MPNDTAPPLWQPDAIVCFSGSMAAARRLAAQLNLPCHTIELHSFPDGESRVRVDTVCRRPAFYQSLEHPNAKVMPLLLAASALRDRGAASVTLIAPYLAYMRQDKAFRLGEAISQRVFCELLGAYFDAFVSVDPHLHRVSDLSDAFRKKPALALSAAPAFAAYASQTDIPRNTLIVGPDQESQPLVRSMMQHLKLEGLIARKTRPNDRAVEIALLNCPDLNRRPAIVIDDIVSSGRTTAALTAELKKRGAASVDVFVTHALCDETAARELRASGVRALISTDTVAHSSNRIAIAKTIADGLTAAAAQA